MSNEQKQLDKNTGITFVNKSENSGAPNQKGFLNIDGVVYKLVMWKRISKAGNEYNFYKIEKQTSTSESK